MVDLAQRGVLAQQCSLAAAQVGDVAHEHDRAARPGRARQRHGTQAHRRGGVLDFSVARCSPAHHEGHTLVSGSGSMRQACRHARQVAAFERRRQAQSPEGRDRVGAREVDDAVSCQPDETVANARRRCGRIEAGQGVGAVRDHVKQEVGGLEIDLLQPAADSRDLMACQHGNDAPVIGVRAQRQRFHAGGHMGFRLAMAHRLAHARGQIEVGSPAARDERPDDVLRDRCRRGGRAYERCGDPSPGIPGRQPQDQVGECKVGHQAPRADERLEPVDLLGRQVGALLREAVE